MKRAFKSLTRVLIPSLFLLALTACGGGGGEESPAATPSTVQVPVDTQSSASSVVISASKTEPVVAQVCGNAGGIAIYSGFDANGNNKLDVEEHFPSSETNQNPKVVCNGGNGVSSLIATEPVSSGSLECPYGGMKLEAGLDINLSGVLDATEVDQSYFICSAQNDSSTLVSTVSTATLSGKIELASIAARPLLAARTENKKGGLWLTPDAILAAIETDVQSRTGTVPTPLTGAIPVDIDANGNYQIEGVPSGVDYSLTYVDEANAKGVKLEGLTFQPGEIKTQNINDVDLSPTGSVTLQLQSLTGQPISSATVILHTLDQIYTTDVSGNLTIDLLPQGQYALTAQADGYVGQYQSFQVTSGAQTDLQILQLNSERGALRGRVEVDGLNDFGNVVVYAQSADASIYTALSNRAGNYTFPALPVGEGYSVIVSAHDYTSAKLDNITISSGQTAVAAALKIVRNFSVNGGATVGIVEGFARFSEQSDFNHAGIIISLEGTDYEAITSRDGAFVLNGIPAGNYTLNVTDSNHSAHTQAIEVVAGASTRLTDISLLPVTGGVSGAVQDEAGNPVENVFVSTVNKGQTVSAVTNVDGLFELAGVLAGGHRITFGKDGYNATAVEVEVVENQTADITATPAVLQRQILSGQIQLAGSTDHSGASVLLVGTDIPVAISDGEGRFNLYGATAGQYILQVNKSGYLNYSEIVSVEQSQQALVEVIQLEPLAGSVSGQLSFPEDFGDFGAMEIVLLNTSGTHVTQSSVQPDGSFLLTNIEPQDGLILSVRGFDAQGNAVNSVNLADISVAASQLTIIDTAVNISLLDPNPPVFTSITSSDGLSINSNGQWMVNPSQYSTLLNGAEVLTAPQYINLTALAQDLDGDAISYQFEATAGEFVLINGSQARWIAPNVGGLVEINVTATSRNRSTTSTVSVAVNNYPEITLLGPDELAFPIVGVQYSRSILDIISFSARVDDIEDARLIDNSIEWHSSLQGLLGSGENLDVTLRPGLHEITVKATDSQGLSSTSENYLAEITPPEQILLKIDGADIDLNGAPLPSTFDLNIQANGLTLEYRSNNELAAIVNSSGTISSVNSGTSIITVNSIEVGDNGKPLYTTELVVRVIDKVVDASAQQTLSINQIKDVRIDSLSNARPFRLENLDKGNYLLMLFDKQDIVPDSKFNSAVMSGTAAVSTRTTSNLNPQVLHEFSVSVAGTTLELELVGAAATADAIFKVGLFPGVDVRTIDGYINQTFWDHLNEPNDGTYVAKPLVMQTNTSSSLVSGEQLDYFSFDVIEGREYVFGLSNSAASFSNVYVTVGDYTDKVRYQSAVATAKGERRDIEFTATATAPAIVQLYGGTKFKNYNYEIVVLPSKLDGLKQNNETHEPNNTVSTAYPLEPQVSLTSKLSNNEVFDYFSFDAISGETYTIDISNALTSASTLYVEAGPRSSTNTYVSSTALSKGAFNSLSFVATETGPVLVKLRGGSPYNHYGYTLTLLPETNNGLLQDGLTHEPNNNTSTAYPLVQQETISSRLTTSEVFDYFSFEVVSGETYSLDVTNSANSSRSLYFEAGIGGSTDSYIASTQLAVGELSSQSFVANETGMVFVRLRGYYAYENYEYTVTLLPETNNGLLQDALTHEPNNNTSTAYPLVQQETISSRLTTSEVFDYFSFEVVSGETYSLDVTNSSNSSRSLYFEAGIAGSTDSYIASTLLAAGGISSQSFVANETGMVFVRLRGYYAYENYEYTVTLLPETSKGLLQDALTHEPNNTAATAYPLKLQEPLASKLSSSESIDYFSFEVVSGEIYTLEITNALTSFSVSGGLKFKAGTASNLAQYIPATSVSRGALESYSFTAIETGEVIVAVYGTSAYKNYDYTLSLLPETGNGLVQNSDTLEPNNSVATAFAIAQQETISSKLTTAESIDYFSFDAVQGEIYTLEVTNAETSFSVTGGLKFKVSTASNSSTYINATSVARGTLENRSFIATETGQVVVSLYGSKEYENYDYTLTLLPETGKGLIHDTVTYEPNNSSAIAYPLSLQQTLNSQLTVNEAFDYYSFEVIAGQNYTVEVSNAETSFAVTGGLKFQVGTSGAASAYVSATSIGRGTLESRSFTATESGSVYISLFGSQTYKNYDYSIQLSPN